MTRIIAGRFRGHRLLVPPGNDTRPTSDRVREAVFSKLMNDDAVEGAQVLDLFAGSGGLGLEALSRGARQVTLVDIGKRATNIALRNVITLGVGNEVQVVNSDAQKYPAARARSGGVKENLNLVFLDPPYDYPNARVEKLLANLVANQSLASGAVVVVERSSRMPEPHWPEDFALTGTKKYGETAVYYLKYQVGDNQLEEQPVGEQEVGVQDD